MQVTLDSTRILHLIALLLSSFLIAKILQFKLDWTPLSAWGLGITLSCQVSNAIMKIMDPENSNNNNNNYLDENEKWQQQRKRELEKRKERRTRGASAGDGNNEKEE
jgi:hypothetical protein